MQRRSSGCSGYLEERVFMSATFGSMAVLARECDQDAGESLMAATATSLP
jgi:hypothetical protein